MIYISVSIFLTIYMSFSMYTFSKTKRILLRHRILSFARVMIFPSIASGLVIWASIDACEIIYGNKSIDNVRSFSFLGVAIGYPLFDAIGGLILRDRNKFFNMLAEKDDYFSKIFFVSKIKPLIPFHKIAIPGIILIFPSLVATIFAAFYDIRWLLYLGASLSSLGIFASVIAFRSKSIWLTKKLRGSEWDLKKFEKSIDAYLDEDFIIDDISLERIVMKWIKKMDASKIEESFGILKKNDALMSRETLFK